MGYTYGVHASIVSVCVHSLSYRVRSFTPCSRLPSRGLQPQRSCVELLLFHPESHAEPHCFILKLRRICVRMRCISFMALNCSHSCTQTQKYIYTLHIYSMNQREKENDEPPHNIYLYIEEDSLAAPNVYLFMALISADRHNQSIMA